MSAMEDSFFEGGGTLRAIDNSDQSDQPVVMKIKEIGTLDAKTRLSQLLTEVQRGRRFHITKHGKPIAELGPLRSSAKRPKAGFAKGTFTYVSDDFDAPLKDFAPYMK